MKICVDPGHGMSNRTPNVFDPGATHQEGTTLHKEADIALKYGLSLKDAFRAKGVSVFMTRDDNTDHAPVGKRAAAAEESNCDAYISLHMNDVDDDTANGTEVLYRDSGDRVLAVKLQSELINLTGLRDRGVKVRNDLAVLRFNGTAVLIELGFIANDTDRNKLLEPQVRNAVCEAITVTTMTHMGWAIPLHGASAIVAGGAISSEVESDEGNENDSVAASAHAFSLEDPLIQGDLPLTEDNLTNTFGPTALTTEFDLEEFEELVHSWGLRYFSPAELLFLGGRNIAGTCAGLNSRPPRGKWNRMKLTALMADEIRHRFGYPIRILSAYRNDAYNNCIDGAPGSMHRQFNALDIQNSGGSLSDLHAIARSVRGSKAEYKGGIKKYNSFVHIDTRGITIDF